jgi:hypothetical protein
MDPDIVLFSRLGKVRSTPWAVALLAIGVMEAVLFFLAIPW